MFPQFTPEYLGATILIGQGMPNAFTNNTGAKRKEVLERLTNADFMIEDIKTRLTKIKDKTTTELREAQDQQLKWQTEKNIADREIHVLKDDLENMPNDTESRARLLETERQIASLLAKHDVIDLTQLAADGQKAGDELKEKELAWENEKNEKIREKEKAETTIQYDLGVKKSEISSVTQEIQKAKNVKDVCYACNQKLPDVHKIDATEMERKLTGLEAEKKALEEQLNSAIEVTKAVRNQYSANVSIDGLRATLTHLRALYSEKNAEKLELARQIDSQKGEKERLTKLIENHLNLVKMKQERVAELTMAVGRLDDLLEKQTGVIANINDKVGMVNKIYSFATKEFRTMLLDDTILRLEARAKTLCQTVMGTDRIEFRQDGASIFIGYDGKELEGLSGSEKQVVMLAIQIALKQTLEEQFGESNIICFDEVFDNCDVTRADKMVEMMMNINAESVFVISHNAGINLPTDKNFYVVKTNNIAELDAY
jgi:hypothetical protein